MGLERLKLYPKVKILEEDWRDLTNHGELSGDDYTLTSDQFFEVMRNQVTLYVQRMTSKALAQGDNEQSTAFVLKYLVTAIDDLRSTVISVQKTRYTLSVDDLTVLRSIMSRGQGRGGGRKGKFLGNAKHKRKQGLRCESARYPHLERKRDREQDHQQGTTGDISPSITPELVGTQSEVNSTCECITALTDLKTGRSRRYRFHMHYSTRAVPGMDSESARYQGTIEAKAQEVFFGPDQGRSVVGFIPLKLLDLRTVHTWRGNGTERRIISKGRPAISTLPLRQS